MHEHPASQAPILVLGATGKTGARVARQLRQRGLAVRSAARHGAEQRFDWDDASTFDAALRGVSALYLVAPTMRIDFAAQVSRFLDRAERAGVRHVTYLSAHGMEQAPAELAPRAVELDLASRTSLGHTLLRPAWFMQNFSDTFLRPVNGEIAVPCGGGSEAFVNAEDIAAVAVATLCEPARHAGRAYAPTGPAALSFAQAAALLSQALGRRIVYRDVAREPWIDALLRAGVPAGYGAVLRGLTETLASGHGARPNDDVLRVSGRPPSDFAAFARALADTAQPSPALAS